MLDLLTNSHRLCDGISRRNMLRVGALGIGGLSMADLFRLQAEAAESGEYRTSPSRKSVILLWQNGGPSHLETYDLKPNRTDPTAVGTSQMADAICKRMAELG